MGWIKTIETEEQAREMNKRNAKFQNGKTDWKVGDQYCDQASIAGLIADGDATEV